MLNCYNNWNEFDHCNVIRACSAENVYWAELIKHLEEFDKVQSWFLFFLDNVLVEMRRCWNLEAGMSKKLTCKYRLEIILSYWHLGIKLTMILELMLTYTTVRSLRTRTDTYEDFERWCWWWGD